MNKKENSKDRLLRRLPIRLPVLRNSRWSRQEKENSPAEVFHQDSDVAQVDEQDSSLQNIESNEAPYGEDTDGEQDPSARPSRPSKPPIPRSSWGVLNTPPTGRAAYDLKRLAGVVRDAINKPILTVTSESGVVRVVVFKGKQAVAWGTAHVETDEENYDIGQIGEAHAVEIFSILRGLGYYRLNLVAEMPLYAPLIRRFELSKVDKKYIGEVVTSEVLETVPFIPEEIDIAWRYLKDGISSLVFATATPKRVIDRQAHTFHRAGLRPSAAYSRAVALAASVNISDVIVAHVTDHEIATVLVRNNVPKLSDKIDLPPIDGTKAGPFQALSDAVEQIAGYEHTLDGAEGLSELPVILTGSPASNPRFVTKFRSMTERTVLDFTPPVQYPELFPPSEYAANIGLAVAHGFKGKNGKPFKEGFSPSVTLLSDRHLPRPVPFKPVGAFMALALFGVVAFNATPQVDTQVLEAAQLDARVDNLEKRARTRRLDMGALRTIEEQIEANRGLSEALQLRLDDLGGTMDLHMTRLTSIAEDAKPDEVALTSISVDAKEIILAGQANSVEDVIEYTSLLRELGSEVFEELQILRVAVSGSVGREDGGMATTFQVRASLPYDDSLEEDDVENLQKILDKAKADADSQ